VVTQNNLHTEGPEVLSALRTALSSGACEEIHTFVQTENNCTNNAENMWHLAA